MLKYQLLNPSDIKQLNGGESQYRGVYKLKGYQICKFIRPLFIRYAFPQDHNLQKDTSQGQYYKFQQTYGQLEQYLVNKYELQEKYHEIIQKMQRDMFSKRKSDMVRDRSREKVAVSYEQQESCFEKYIKQRDSRSDEKVIKQLRRESQNLNDSFLIPLQLVTKDNTV